MCCTCLILSLAFGKVQHILYDPRLLNCLSALLDCNLVAPTPKKTNKKTQLISIRHIPGFILNLLSTDKI